MATKLTAVCRISYERSTDLIEVTGNRTTGLLPSKIETLGYDILSRDILGWGDYNAVIDVDGDPFDGTYGTFLAKLTESEGA